MKKSFCSCTGLYTKGNTWVNNARVKWFKIVRCFNCYNVFFDRYYNYRMVSL